jgi:hypothetical protein
MDLREVGWDWIELAQDRDRWRDYVNAVEGLCDRDDEPPGSIKCWKVLEQLHNWLLLKKGSAP